jgi:hypothetical protein
MVLVYLPFISFAPPKETKQRTPKRSGEAFLYEFFDNEVKNRFQNLASLRTSAPVLKAFENYSTPQVFTAWNLDCFFCFKRFESSHENGLLNKSLKIKAAVQAEG